MTPEDIINALPWPQREFYDRLDGIVPIISPDDVDWISLAGGTP